MAIQIGDVLQAHSSAAYIAASAVAAFLGSLAALYHAAYMYRPNGSLDKSMAIGAAVALGGVGIWSMHFIGMIGYKLPFPVAYEGWLTFGSLIAAIVMAGTALLLAGGRGTFSIKGWLLGSLLAGTGVGVMHYMGMYAMNLRAMMNLNPSTVALSFVIAIGAVGAALWLAFHARAGMARIGAAAVMAFAVCAMHYTGMAAAQFVCISAAPKLGWGISGDFVPLLVLAVAGGVLVALLYNLLGVMTAHDYRSAHSANN